MLASINGIDLGSIESNVLPEQLIPELVPGRVLQLDGDMLCYECSGDDDQPFEFCKENFRTALQTRMAMAGAEFCNIHLTGANKGGRFDIALVRAYQANRDGKIKPKHLQALREWVQLTYPDLEHKPVAARYHDNQEADDGIAQGQYCFITYGKPNLSIIMSGDKDLGMCSGLHCDWNTFEITEISGYGSIYLDETGSTKKIKGRGTAFFWAQLLMGDTADNILGCPSFGVAISSSTWPTAAYTEAVRKVTEKTMPTGKPCTALQLAKAQEVLDSAKAKPCGPVAVYDYLKDCTDDLSAFMKCIKAYQGHYGTEPFEMYCHRGEKHTKTSGHMLLEQAQLLWMRRVENECPSVFFKQVTERIGWDGQPLGGRLDEKAA